MKERAMKRPVLYRKDYVFRLSKTIAIMFFFLGVFPGCMAGPVALILSPSAETIEIIRGETVTFQGVGVGGVAFEDGDESYGYFWDTDGNVFDEGSSTNSGTVDVAFNELGTFTVSFTVTDRTGTRDTAAVTVVVRAETASEPLAAAIVNPSAGPVDVFIGSTLHFLGRATGGVPYDTTGDGSGAEPYDYFWDVLRLSGVSLDGDSRENDKEIALVFELPGTYDIVLTVRDSRGVTDTMSTVVNVGSPSTGIPLRAVILTPPLGSLLAKTNATVSFRGRAVGGKPYETSDEDDTYSYFWDIHRYGAIRVASGAADSRAVALTFAAAGNYNIRFVVKDSAGNSDVATINVLVTH